MLASTRKNRERFAIKKSYSIENGYPSQRRSLVGDARFETQLNRDAKKSWLEEIRQISHDSEFSEDDLIFIDETILSPPPVPLLAAEQEGKNLGKEEEIKAEEATIVVSLAEEMISLARIIKTIWNCKGTIMHLETRVARTVGTYFDIMIKMMITKVNLLVLLKSLRQSQSISNVSVISTEGLIKAPWYPKHISELDLCNHLMTKYEPDLDMNHPGFSDPIYRERRKMVADIAFTYKHGEKIPRVEYTEKEIGTWGHVFSKLVALLPTHACKQYIDAFTLLQKEVGYRADNIPQLQDISDFLQKKTGFTLRPAAGLLTARDFLASLAYRVFQCTQYVRHSSSPDHSPEPDCIHELLGHVPMLADPLFAQFSQELGLAALGATDEEIEKFSTLYWFTVEFGLCKENNVVKAYGAGLLSSYGELEHALSDKPQHLYFEPEKTAIQPYQDQDFQDVYFVADSFHDVKEKFRKWVQNSMSRPYEVRYDPFTQTIEMLDSVDKLEDALTQIKLEVNYLSNAVSSMKFK